MPYCQYCGTKLEDGQTCTCEMAQAAANQPSQPQQATPQPSQPQQATPQQATPQQATPQQATSQQATSQQTTSQQTTAPAAPRPESQVSIVFRKFKLYLASYISDPTQAVRTVMEAEYDSTIPIILTVIRLLAMGLAIYGLLSKVCRDALALITTTILRYSNSAGILTAKLTASLFQSLFCGALIAAIGMLLFAAMLYVLVLIQHGSSTFADCFKASAANGVPTTALLLLAFLCSFISAALCVFVIALSMLSWIISGVRTARLVVPNSDSGLFGIMYFVGVVLIIIVGYWVMPTIFSWAVGGITASYMDEKATLRSAFYEIRKELADDGVSSFKEFYSNTLKGLFETSITEFWHTLY